MNVWVTRDEGPSGPLCTALAHAGLTPICAPVLARRIVCDLAATVGPLAADDWLVLTSIFTTESLSREWATIPQCAVVGPMTRRAAEATDLRVALESSVHTRDGLFDALRQCVSRGRVCYPRSDRVIAPAAWAEVNLISPVLYETSERSFAADLVDRVDVIAVASPSAVIALGQIDKPFASIGPSTSAALRDLSIEPWIESEHRTFTSLADAIATAAGKT